MSLGLRASSDEASPSAVKSEPREEEDEEFDGDDNMETAGSGDDSEYVGSRRDIATKKRPRKAKGVNQIDEGDESVRLLYPCHFSMYSN